MTVPTKAKMADGDATQNDAVLSDLGELNAMFATAPRGAYTQTYSTADKTIAAATATTVATTAATTLTPYGYAQAQADAIPVAINALIADNLDLRQAINAIIDDLQALLLVG